MAAKKPVSQSDPSFAKKFEKAAKAYEAAEKKYLRLLEELGIRHTTELADDDPCKEARGGQETGQGKKRARNGQETGTGPIVTV